MSSLRIEETGTVCEHCNAPKLKTWLYKIEHDGMFAQLCLRCLRELALEPIVSR